MNLHAPGSRIAGRYQVAGRPLMGGMGIVYLCYDHTDQRPVALKTFKPEYLPDRDIRDRFLREGDTWIKLGLYPHIVRAYSVQRVGDGTEVYLVLELVAKERDRDDASLRSWLTPGKPWPVEQALLFAMQIVRGMQHATTVIPGFVHRDLKPENLLVGSDKLTNANINRLRVTDLGLAAVLGQVRGASTPRENDPAPFGRTQLTHGIVGTPLYMAPEQWHCNKVSAATDIYALGCIVSEMLAGETIVGGRTLSALQAAHCEGIHKDLPAHVPARLRAWIDCCMAVELGARFAGWGEVAAELGEVYRAVTGNALPPAEPHGAMGRAERVAAGWSNNTIGYAYADMGKAEVALEYFEKAQAIGKMEGQQDLESAGVLHLGSAHLKLGDAKRAIGYYERALSIARESGDRPLESAALGNLGLAYRTLGDARRAIEFHQQDLAIARELGDLAGEGTTLGNLGLAYRSLGDARRAIEFHKQDLAIARSLGDRAAEERALHNIGNNCRDLGDVQSAVEFLQQSLAISQQIGDRSGEGSTCISLGASYAALGNLQQAIAFYARGLDVMRETGDRLGQANALGNLGACYVDLGDGKQAMAFCEECLTILRQVQDRALEGKTLGNLGVAFFLVGDAKRAIGYFERALVITREVGDRHEEGHVLGNLGGVLGTLGDMQKAKMRLEEALVLKKEIGDISGAAESSFNLAWLLAQQGQWADASRYAESAFQMFVQVGHQPRAMQARQLLAHIQAESR